MSGDHLERGLQASVKVYTLALAKLSALCDDEDVGCVISRAELVQIKKAAAAMNRSLAALVRQSHDAENRLTLELHMLRGIMQREHTDREANRARVFELFRRYNGGGEIGSGGGDVDAPLPPTSAGGGGGGGGTNSNPLHAPSTSAMALDRALSTLERIDQSVCDLSPVGRINVHGAGLLSAKQKLDAASEAASMATKAGKRPKASRTT